MKRGVSLLLFCLLSAPAGSAPVQTAAPARSEIPFYKVLGHSPDEPSSWKAEDDKFNMDFVLYDGVATVVAEKTDRPWGAVVKNVSVDLNEFPLLQINVLSADKRWYLILAGPQFRGGFLRLVETGETGPFTYDIPKLAKLKGRQAFDLKLGVSDGEVKALSNHKVSFDKLAFVARPPVPGTEARKPAETPKKGRRQDGVPSVHVFIPKGRDVDLWREAAKDGPQEVTLSVKGAEATVRGKMEDRNWGAARKEVAVDLSKFPVMEINVLSCSKSWYLVLAHPSLPEGYLRLTETPETGNFRFDVASLTGLSGPQTFEVQVGVNNPKGTAMKGEWVVFDLLRFRGKG